MQQKEYYATHGHPLKGRPLDHEFRERMPEIAKQREAGYAPGKREEINKAIGEGNIGKVRTDEQKERYREARCKWMSENPLVMNNTAGERTIAAWLDAHNIAYRRQWVIPGIWHPYDFFLPEQMTIIEFDGAHHWYDSWFSPKETKDQVLKEQMEQDAMLSLHAHRNGYRIIRIYGKADVGDSEEYGSLENQLRLQGFLMPE